MTTSSSRPLAGACALLAALGTLVAGSAHADRRYDDCVREARDVSGWDGEESKSALKGALKGGLGGAALGAAGGWVTGNDSGRSARRGAKLGAVIGAVRTASDNKDLEEKRRVYDRALDACMNRRD